MYNYSRSSKRLLAELKILTKNLDVQSYFQYENSGIDEKLKEFCIYGYLLPRAEPYKHGSFKVRIRLSPEYPFRTPQMDLLTYIYHPAVRNNVSRPTMCTACGCYEWTPSNLISAYIKYFVNVIDQPEAIGTYCVLNSKAKMLYDENRAEYEEIALAMKMILKQLDFNSAKINQLPLMNHLKEYLHSSLYRSKDTEKP
ncbi:unnamed protein product [Rotaria sp. Silwood2]|nr:unnamed protein product [Rotaria sp. Silwood2]CAF4523676.1 unnamed protein product [Rotaria sp. Silwood2]